MLVWSIHLKQSFFPKYSNLTITKTALLIINFILSYLISVPDTIDNVGSLIGLQKEPPLYRYIFQVLMIDQSVHVFV